MVPPGGQQGITVASRILFSVKVGAWKPHTAAVIATVLGSRRRECHHLLTGAPRKGKMSRDTRHHRKERSCRQMRRQSLSNSTERFFESRAA